jgi:CubicO group peptidase (beta-lactamase class C family)
MKTKLIRGFSLFGLLALPMLAKPPADLQSRLDAWLGQEPGGVAVAWVDADGAAFFQAGHFDGADSAAITADTQFELGSITKVFTSLLLAGSEQAGKVSRNDPAARYLLPAGDDAQAALAKITLRSLATHTSGLPRLPANLGPDPDGSPNPYAAWDRELLIAALKRHGVAATPGQKVAYSNFGVSVLGEALAAAWGASYADVLREHVLDPLGMKATSVGLTGAPPPADLAPGHVHGARVPNWTWQAAAPCGGLRSSARDMAALLTACLGSGPLRAALTASEQAQYDDEDTGGRIGLGWLIAGDGEQKIFWHNGATAGSHSLVAFNPAAGRGVVVLANLQKGSEKLGFELLGAEAPKPRGLAVAHAADYPGRYPLNPAFAIAITEHNGALFGQATGQPRFSLRLVAADRFSIVGLAAEISFERDADGKVIALTLHQNGRDQRGPRRELPPAPKTVELPAETLAEYAGRYPLAPTFVLTVTVESGGVAVQATGQSKLPVYASAPDEFYYTVVDARISFTRDAAGKVSGLVLHQNGRDMPAKKAK